jgi:hypothetical protein
VTELNGAVSAVVKKGAIIKIVFHLMKQTGHQSSQPLKAVVLSINHFPEPGLTGGLVHNINFKKETS